ncbi:MAG: hypothetical protein RR775_22500 [Massilia sp.]|uniref:hypothetical protein n=1 Tax=Massilia sp. TaxID=1882437 RepID=UPI002FCAB313
MSRRCRAEHGKIKPRRCSARHLNRRTVEPRWHRARTVQPAHRNLRSQRHQQGTPARRHIVDTVDVDTSQHGRCMRQARHGRCRDGAGPCHLLWQLHKRCRFQHCQGGQTRMDGNPCRRVNSCQPDPL